MQVCAKVAEVVRWGGAMHLDWIDKATVGRQGERTDLHDNIREVKDETS
jgi:hypothetical protein